SGRHRGQTSRLPGKPGRTRRRNLTTRSRVALIDRVGDEQARGTGRRAHVRVVRAVIPLAFPSRCVRGPCSAKRNRRAAGSLAGPEGPKAQTLPFLIIVHEIQRRRFPYPSPPSNREPLSRGGLIRLEPITCLCAASGCCCLDEGGHRRSPAATDRWR